MDENDKVLQEEILPALQKLRKERGQYMQWAFSGSQTARAAPQVLRRLRV